jgi:hypothetical protein
MASGDGGTQRFHSVLIAEEFVEASGESGGGHHGSLVLFEHIWRWLCLGSATVLDIGVQRAGIYPINCLDGLPNFWKRL